ncbi:hypothetical protein BH23GEM11_BH23GEM11_10670 [soil metagenome]
MHLTYAWGDASRPVGESRDVLAFAALFFASIWAARSGRLEAHKRLMLVAGLNLLTPARTRLMAVLDWPVPTVLLLAILTLTLPPVAYDVLTRRSLHRATIAGILFSIATRALVVAIVVSPLLGGLEARLYP